MSSISDIKGRVSMAQLLEHYGADVPWTTMGWTPMICPFHDDTSPSASVNHTDERFVCHGCGVKGDVLDLVQSAELLSDVMEAKDWIEEHLMNEESLCPVCGDEGYVERDGILYSCTICRETG